MYTLTLNTTQSHTTFTGTDGSKYSIANSVAGIEVTAQEPNIIIITEGNDAVLIGTFDNFVGVNIDNTNVTTTVDTILQFYFIKPSGGGGGIPNRIQNTANTTFVNIPLLEDCIVQHSDNTNGVFVTETNTDAKYKIMGPLIQEPNNGLIYNSTPHEIGRVKSSIANTIPDGTTIQLTLKFIATSDSVPASFLMTREMRAYGYAPMTTSAVVGGGVPIVFNSIMLLNAGGTASPGIGYGPDDNQISPVGPCFAMGPCVNTSPYQGSMIPTGPTLRRDGAGGDLIFETPVFGAKRHTTGTTDFKFEITFKTI